MSRFVECDTCNEKPGSPVLCEGCLKNRETITAYEKQNRMLKEQLSIWKRKAGENQLIAGRWQFLFDTGMKAINSIDDVFEYAYKAYTPDELQARVQSTLKIFTDEVAKVRRGPAEEQE